MPSGVELRQPEAVEVRLVADDEVVHERIAGRHVGCERREVGALVVGERRHARPERVQREHDPQPGELGGLDRVVEQDRVGRAELRLILRPGLGDPDRIETGELRLVHRGLREGVVGCLADVLGGPDHHERAARVRRCSAREERHETNDETPHACQSSRWIRWRSCPKTASKASSKASRRSRGSTCFATRTRPSCTSERRSRCVRASVPTSSPARATRGRAFVRWPTGSRRSRRSSRAPRSRRSISSRTSSSGTGPRSTSGCATTSRSRTSPSPSRTTTRG